MSDEPGQHSEFSVELSDSMPPDPRGIRKALITLVSAARLEHARAQWAAVAGHPELERYVVWLDAAPPPPGLGTSIHVPPGINGMRLAEGRDAGASAAIAGGADLLIFLDADCIPADGLIARYSAASLEHPDAVLCGAVTYLAEGHVDVGPQALAAATSPHPARPNPADDEEIVAKPADYDLFWSLSFAVTAFTWQRSGGFFVGYEGYGAEDTDFGATLSERGIPLIWVGGAHAYHQYHPTSSPPWQHLDDILRNAEIYFRRWGRWPMEGWLREFAAARAIEWSGERWVRRVDRS